MSDMGWIADCQLSASLVGERTSNIGLLWILALTGCLRGEATHSNLRSLQALLRRVESRFPYVLRDGIDMIMLSKSTSCRTAFLFRQSMSFFWVHCRAVPAGRVAEARAAIEGQAIPQFIEWARTINVMDALSTVRREKQTFRFSLDEFTR